MSEKHSFPDPELKKRSFLCQDLYASIVSLISQAFNLDFQDPGKCLIFVQLKRDGFPGKDLQIREGWLHIALILKSEDTLMKLVLYNDFQLGVLQDDTVVPVGDSVADLGHHNAQEMMQMIINDWDAMQSRIESAIVGENGVALDTVTLQSPLPRPGQLMCAAVNYIEPRQPERSPFNGFLKANTSVMPTGSTVELPAAEADVFHFEPELALVIGKRASHLSQADALDYVFGYTQFMDVSARGLPGGFFLGKSWHTFAPLGPALVTADEVSNPNDLSVKLWVNNTLKHDFSTGEMARHIPELLEEITRVITLEPGDVVATGTHHEALSPIQDGFKVRLAVEGFGPHLEVSVHDSLKRRW